MWEGFNLYLSVNISRPRSDRRKETAEGQDIEHKVTQTPRAGSRSLQDKGQRGEEERSE